MPLSDAETCAAPRPKMIDDQEIYRTVLAELPVGVYFVDREQRIAFWNHGAEEITGYLSQQVLGHNMGENFLEHVDGANRRFAGKELPFMSALLEGKATEKLLTFAPNDGHP